MKITVSGVPAPPATVVGILDRDAHQAMLDAGRRVRPVVDRETPKSSGQTAAALRPRVGRSRAGASLTVGAPRGRRHGQATVADVVRWVNRGTGIYREGPGPKRPIRSKRVFGRMTLPGGRKVYKVKGQRPDHFIDRIAQLATPAVIEACEQEAKLAAREIETVHG